MWSFLHRLSSPPTFYRWSAIVVPVCGVIAAVLLIVGAVWGLGFTPTDYQQGDSFRIIYVHVPAAMLSLSVYMAMAFSAAIFLIWRIKLADVFAASFAPVGAAFTLLALVTGSIWGRPTWGTWWEWDARLTSELILLFLYIGVMALRASLPERQQAARAAALLAIVGVINVPIIHFSVEWWNSLHQGSTVSKLGRPAIDPSMAPPLYMMIFGFFFFWMANAFARARVEIVDREQNKRWVREALGGK